MKKFTVVLVAAAVIASISLVSWLRSGASGHSGTAYGTTMQISGTPGAAFICEYVRAGKRVTISGAVPWSLTASNISRMEIRKAKVEDTLVLEARGGGSMVSAPCGPDSKGLRLNTEGGWNVEFIR